MNQSNIKYTSNGVMFNAYPDSIGAKLSDTVNMLQLPEFKDVFSLFYVLPTFFNSDLDRGFSVIDYNLNTELVSKEDLKAFERLHIQLKFDIVLNHLSVNSPQFKDLLLHGEDSKYKDFFINWNSFWEGNGTMGNDGVMIPDEAFLSKLFMRKSGLPILKVPFPDGSERPYWNTFYQQVNYKEILATDLSIDGLSEEAKQVISDNITALINKNEDPTTVDLSDYEAYRAAIVKVINAKKTFLGQMDVNANSDLIWEFYEETLAKTKSYGCAILRLDAFAYLHKEIGQTNFFNKPGTWDYLKKIKKIADKNELVLLPEIHAEYGLHLHDEVASEGYQIYDFFLPGLMIHTLEQASNTALVKWGKEIVQNGYKTVNMLGCHDGIPVLDLKGKEVNGTYRKGLLEDEQIDAVMNLVLDRGGRVKNLYDADGNKISYYQVNATFFSALGENEQKLLLARAIQLFMPGVPQVWYLDLFAGKNNYAAANKGGAGSHKEINRTTLSNKDIKDGLKTDVVINQLILMRLRNTLPAFSGEVVFEDSLENELHITWKNKGSFAKLKSNLNDYSFTVEYSVDGVLINKNIFH